MNESKEVLEATLKGLEEKISQLNDDLMMKKKELEDINKPEMTWETYSSLESCIIEGTQDALGQLKSEDVEAEYGMEYDGKVYLESFTVPEDGLVEKIMDEITRRFKILNDNSQLNIMLYTRGEGGNVVSGLNANHQDVDNGELHPTTKRQDKAKSINNQAFFAGNTRTTPAQLRIILNYEIAEYTLSTAIMMINLVVSTLRLECLRWGPELRVIT